MSFWRKADGALIGNADGKLIKCDTCPCDSTNVNTYWTIFRRRLYARLLCGRNYTTSRIMREDPLLVYYYYGQYIINNNSWQAFGYYGCNDLSAGSQCSVLDWTLAKTQTWLSNGVQTLNSEITNYFGSLNSWQSSDLVSGINSRLYSNFPYANSSQSCQGYQSPDNDARTALWSCYTIKCLKHPDAPSTATGISATLEWVKYSYTGLYNPETYLPVYTKTSGVINHNFLWGLSYNTPIADNVTHNFNQHNSTTYDLSRPGPCDNSYERYTFKLIALKYLK